ncbi:hypothetical protein D3C72_838510 [compost metagenome]
MELRIGVYQNYFCFEGASNVFYKYEGFIVRNQPNALPGSFWVEASTNDLHYVDESRNIRRIPGTIVKTVPGTPGSAWTEGVFFEWVDSNQNKRQGKVAVDHGDVAHADSTTAGYNDHTDSPYGDAGYSDHGDSYNSYSDYTDHDNIGHGDYTDSHSDSHIDHNDTYHGNQHYDYGYHSDTEHVDGGPTIRIDKHSNYSDAGYTDHTDRSHSNHNNSTIGAHSDIVHSDIPYTDFPQRT